MLNERLYAHPPDIFNSKTVIRYGLLERCERQVIDFPGPGQNGRIHYTDYSCRAFPSRKEDRCESDNRYFCTLWWTAGYAAELGVVFGAAALMAVLVGVSTRSRRRRVWRGIAGLQALHGKRFSYLKIHKFLRALEIKLPLKSLPLE